MSNYALAGNGVHFEIAWAIEEWNALGYCFAAVVKPFPQSAKRLSVSFEAGVETAGQLEDEESLGFQDSRKLVKVLERVSRRDVLEDDRGIDKVD